MSELIEELRERDHPAWKEISERVVAGLVRKLGASPAGLPIEDFALSALRTCWRRLGAQCDAKLETCETLDSVVGWLIVVARHRFLDARRRLEREQPASPNVTEEFDRAAASSTGEAAEEIVGEFYATLTLEEKIIVKGKLEGLSDSQIGDQIASEVKERKGKCSRSTVRNLRHDLETRLKAWAEKARME
jgi:DNA-directed RNA polymerase specialized sigma24 family protein